MMSLTKLYKKLRSGNGSSIIRLTESTMGSSFKLACSLTFIAANYHSAIAQQQPIPSPGFRPHPPSFHVFEHAKLVISPDLTLEDSNLVIRDGVIIGVNLPDQEFKGARRWDMRGKTIYPGWIDLWAESSGDSSSGEGEDGHTHNDHELDSATESLTAGVVYQSLQFYGAPGEQADTGVPGPSYESPMTRSEVRQAEEIRPDNGFFKLRRDIGFGAINWVPENGVFRGTTALTLLSEGDPNQWVLKPDTFQAVSFRTSRGPWNRSSFPGSMMGVISLIRQTWFDAQHDLELWRAYQETPTITPRPVWNPSLKALHPSVQGSLPLLVKPGNEVMAYRAGVLAKELGWNWVLVTRGQDWRRPDFLKSIGAPVALPLTFPEAPDLKQEEAWDEVSLETLRAWDWAPRNASLVHEMGLKFVFTMDGLKSGEVFRKNLHRVIESGLPESEAIRALTETPADLLGASSRLGSLEAGKLANLVVVHGDTFFDEKNPLHSVWVEGEIFSLDLNGPEVKDKGEEKKEDTALADGSEKTEASDLDSEKATESTEGSEAIAAVYHASLPLDERGPISKPDALLLVNAEIWTSGPAGVLQDASILIQSGKIVWVGQGLPSPESTQGIQGLVIRDMKGKSLTPGLIDAHSHGMIVGGVNESTLPSSAMVRIADVVDSESRNIELQLAGGLTVANLLHGSANPIGGQSQVIKLKDGADPDSLKMKSAPGGIKFALGENVKQSNWGDNVNSRFPQTRMGVRTFMANRFTAAQTYRKDWEAFANSGSVGAGPRRNLELEALMEILQGDRWIHCHSYRQDEILMLIRLMEDFGVRIGTFQHVLEGYKVADEIAAHGAGASTFSDWWAYKFEVYDAIGYAGSLMRDRGALVSFNSDSADVARRMNLEAAKAVKYGATPEPEALKFVTLNPAIQLGIADRVGSLELGKDADIAIWSGSPLDSRTVCLETWIEGAQYFSLEEHVERIAKRSKEREMLVKKITSPDKKTESKDSGSDSDSDSEADKPSEEGVARFWAIEKESRHTLEYSCREDHEVH